MNHRLPNTMRAQLFCFCIALLLPTTNHAMAATVLHYDATLTPNLAQQSIVGKVTISLITKLNIETTLTFDAGTLNVDDVQYLTDKPRPASSKAGSLLFTKTGSKLNIALPADNRRDPKQVIKVAISYHGNPMIGMRFLPEAKQIYTAFSTGQWMPSISSPDNRATLRLTLVAPTNWTVAANGEMVASSTANNAQRQTTWALTTPTPAYLYGFAMGEFREVFDREAKPELRYLAPHTFTEDEIRRIFKDTRDMIQFYEKKSGHAYPSQRYTQILVNDGAAQELEGLAVMSARYGKRVLEDEKRVWLAAHELSHQWWGNRVTNGSWNEFWLNEGIATFMNAAWFESRYGREEYMRHIDAAKKNFEKIRDDGQDKPLVFPNWDKPTASDRSLVYDKGAYVMHLLREELGEEIFWRGFHRFTTRYWGKSVTTNDLKRTMEDVAEKSLDAFFEKFVFAPSPVLEKKKMGL